jgi:zinc-ribbon domain
MYCTSCGTKNPEDANFCAKCGKHIARTSGAAATPSKHPFDPQLAGYDLLRRLISGRPPFNPVEEWHPKAKKIPAGFEADVDVAVHAYQLFAFLEMAKCTYGLAISEKIRTHILLLSSFDANFESRLPTLFEAFRAGIAIHDPESPRWHPIDDPRAKFHIDLAVSVMYPPSWPEKRKAELLVPVAERLDTGRLWAEGIFGPELKTPVQVADTFQWSESPGPFERQLQRQRNNPLFPAKDRTVSAHQVADARVADLKQVFGFMQDYKPFVRRGLSLCGKWTIKEASDFLKEAIDLSERCSVLGDYSAPEAKVLKTATEATQREIVETTDDAALQDLWKEYGAQADVGALLQKLTTGFPPGCDADDYTVRTVLSEDLQTIVNYAAICSFSGLAENVRGRAEKIVAEAMRDGMPSGVANTRLAAFLSGLDEGRPKKTSEIWSRLKGIVRR